MFECPVASSLLDSIYEVINCVLPPLVGNEGFPLVKSLDHVIFFHLPSALPGDIRQDINDVFMIVKHYLYRARMREDHDSVPNLFNSLLPVTLELGKLARCRFANSMDFFVIESIKHGLESVMGVIP